MKRSLSSDLKTRTGSTRGAGVTRARASVMARLIEIQDIGFVLITSIFRLSLAFTDTDSTTLLVDGN